MTTHRFKDNSFKGVVISGLFIVLSFKSCFVSAQSSREVLDKITYQKVTALEDSIKKSHPKKFPTYVGGELSLTHYQYALKSKIGELSNLPVSFLGTNVGAVWGNPVGKSKASAGMYYSDASVPYTIEMLQASISTSVYFLRLHKVKYHALEPYASIGLTFQKNSYRGNYLSTDQNNNPVQSNSSSSDAPLLGRTNHELVNTALGVEYQLESSNKLFIHLFAEVGYAFEVASGSTRKDFNGTSPTNLSSFSVGISFGSFR
jgi:hypothetical protein